MFINNKQENNFSRRSFLIASKRTTLYLRMEKVIFLWRKSYLINMVLDLLMVGIFYSGHTRLHGSRSPAK